MTPSANAPSGGLDLSLLGPVRARAGSDDLPLGGRRQRAVLARLAVAAGEVIAVERLVDDLWHGEPPPSANNTLQSYVSNLRRILGPSPEGGPVVARVGAGYRLALPPEALAAERFVALVQAGTLEALDEGLALWRGPALADFADEPWAQGDAVRLDELRLTAIESRFDRMLDAGRHAEIVGGLEAVVQAHPLRERFTAQLVIALYRCGRQADALRAIDRTRSVLVEELGLDPGPELAGLTNRVLDHDPTLAAPAATEAAASVTTAPPVGGSGAGDPVAAAGSTGDQATVRSSASPAAASASAPAPSASSAGPGHAAGADGIDPTRSEDPGSERRGRASEAAGRQVSDAELVAALVDDGPISLPPAVAERRRRSRFVGRAAEVAHLQRSWDAVVAGDRRLVVVAGEPGMGKTRLALRFSQAVHDGGGHVLWGRCTAESLIAYQPAVEAIRTALRPLELSAVAELLRVRPALARLLPEVGDRSPDTVGRGERYDLYDGLAGLLGELSTLAPVLLVVDDLQWADTSTLALLDHLVRADRTGRLLVVATVRRPAGRPTPELDRLLLDLRREQRVDEIDLEGVDGDAVADLLTDLGVDVDAGVAAVVQERTGGNPFFVESLAVDGEDLARLDPRSLPSSVRDLLDQRIAGLEPAAALVLSAAAVIGQRVELDLLGTVTGLDPSALLDVVDDAVERGLLVEDEDLGWVAFPHALVRQGLVARTTRNREARLHLAVADGLAARLPGSVPAATIAAHLLAAGPASPARRTAEASLEAARESLVSLADAEALWWVERARLVLGLAEDGTGPDHPDADLRADLDLLAARAARNLARMDEAAAAVARVADHARTHGDALLLGRAAEEAAQLGAGVGFSIGGVDDDRVALLVEALAVVTAEHPEARLPLLAWTSIALSGGDDRPGQAALADEAWTIAATLERDDLLALAAYARRLAFGGHDGLDERLEVGPVMVDAARRAGWTELELIGLLLSTVDLIESDRIDDATAALDEVRALLERSDRAMFRVYVHFIDAGLALLRGDLVAGEASSAEGLAVGEAAHGGNAMHAWGAEQFVLANFRGEQAALVPVVEGFIEEYPTMPAWKAALSACLVNAGDDEGARAAVVAALDDGPLLRHDQTGYTALGQLAEVVWHLRDAELAERLLPLLEPVADRLAVSSMGAICVGPLRRYLGLVLGVLGRTDEAIAALDEAIERCRTGGFAPYLARGLAERATLREEHNDEGDREGATADRAEAESLAADLGIHLTLTPTRLTP